MLPKWHALLGAIFSIILVILFPAIGWLGAFVIFASSVLIDVDHYLWYVWKEKDWSLKKAYFYLKNSKRKVKRMMILHTFEFLLLLGIASFYSKFLFYILIGFVFHSIVDIIDMLRTKELNEREFFFVNWFRKFIFSKK